MRRDVVKNQFISLLSDKGEIVLFCVNWERNCSNKYCLKVEARYLQAKCTDCGFLIQLFN